MRKLSTYTSTEIEHLLNQLIDAETTHERYREAMTELGRSLGKQLISQDSETSENVMLACSSEDADWLASGVLDEVGVGTPVSVFWTERYNVGEGLEISPIIRSFEEPIEKCNTLIIVKSIINTSCVVKTQLNRLVEKLNPEKIYILAPVMYVSASESLELEFPNQISKKFRYISFATDDELQGSTVVPGIGGMVYARLGLSDVHAKNKYTPNLVKKRLGLLA